MRAALPLSFFLLAALGAGGGATPAGAAEETHPFSVEDLVRFERIGDPQVSPDGARVVFVVRETDMEANRGRTDLYRVDVDGSRLVRLTTHEANDWNPRFAPDGESVYFLSTRSGSSQAWRMPLDGGEAVQVTDLPLDLLALAVSPDGERLAFGLAVFPECETIECTTKRLEEREKDPATGRLYEKLFIRHWDHWKDGRRNHVFAMKLEGGEPVDLMAGMDADCPTQPFGGPEDFTFTPDSKGVVFTARDVGREEAWSVDFDLYLSPVDGSAPPSKITVDNRAWDAAPAFSPDGKQLAYVATVRPGYESDRRRVVVMDWPEGEPRALTEDWDHSPGGVSWTRDGRELLATADFFGQHPLFAIDAKSGAVRQLVEEGKVRSPQDAGGKIVFGLESLRSPVELHTIAREGGASSPITAINGERLAKVRMGEPEQFTFKGWNDETVYAYLVRPVDFDPEKKYPVAFLIHGGPQGSFGNDFHYRWNPQTYAGAGYAAVMVDFHGSTGYGQDFTDSIRGDWGGKPLEDLKKGLAAALERYPFLEGDNVCALGASFGGYMINWIAGQWPDRFRCLVNHDGNLDERMAYFDTEELWFPEWEHRGTPWTNPEGYSKHNPVEHVDKWKTPMLVIHGALDFRVVETQGIATFTALQRQGIPSQFLYFPDENHWVLKPHNSILWHETVLGWLERWTSPETGAKARGE